MFRHLFDFGYQRSALQAVGFYLAYVVMGILSGGVIGAVYALAFGTSDLGPLVWIAGTFAVAFVGLISFLVLQAKGRLGHPGPLVVGVLSVPAAILGGVILGFLFTAFLTTRPALHSADADADADAETMGVGATY